MHAHVLLASKESRFMSGEIVQYRRETTSVGNFPRSHFAQSAGASVGFASSVEAHSASRSAASKTHCAAVSVSLLRIETPSRFAAQ
jgi:hypothetical protein